MSTSKLEFKPVNIDVLTQSSDFLRFGSLNYEF